MEKWRVMSRDEQETIIRVDYRDCEVILYTTREAVARRFEILLGTPDKTFRVKDEGICGVEWRKPFEDCGAFFHKSKIIGKVASIIESESEERHHGDDVEI